MSMPGIIPGLPGPRAATPISYGRLSYGQPMKFLPGGGRINGTKTRDTTNTVAQTLLNPGLPMGLITATKLWANSVIGVSTGAITGAGTTLTIAVVQAVELVRRVGSTGNLTLTGAPLAGQPARSLVVPYSAVNVGNGQITITPTLVTTENQVEDIIFNIASTGGNLQLIVTKPDGTRVQTASAAWNTTDATYLAAIQTQLDASTGVTNGIVASARPGVDTDLGIRLTYSGTGYTGLNFTPAAVALLPTSSTAWNVQSVSAGASGAFVAGSWVGDTDGSQIPRSFIYDGFGITEALAGGTPPSVVEWPNIPFEGNIDSAQIVYWPSDVGLRQWIVDSVNGNNNAFADFRFSHSFKL